MACVIGDNRPLTTLARELGIVPACHGKRPECVLGRYADGDANIMGATGAAIGYCQALFARLSDAEPHTRRVRRLLQEINAPWRDSHELYWGYRASASASEYIADACAPLADSGRVPILITGLDPASDRAEIEAILRTSPRVPASDCVLVRVVIRNSRAADAIADMIDRIVSDARRSGSMPRWWPLIQGDVSATVWAQLRERLGANWRYANIAVNPFTPADVLTQVSEQITVAQLPIGAADGVGPDGVVHMHPLVPILGASADATYSVDEYAAVLAVLGCTPTLILLGPSHSTWSDDMNQARVAKMLPLLRTACDRIWDKLPSQRRDEVWSLAC